MERRRRYNYVKAVTADIREWVKENYIMDELKDELRTDYENTWETLSEELFCEDSITGNASGSYTHSRWQAEENLCHNLGLLYEACREFCTTPDLSNPEACDVTIRCYLLNECLPAVLEEIKNA